MEGTKWVLYLYTFLNRFVYQGNQGGGRKQSYILMYMGTDALLKEKTHLEQQLSDFGIHL